MARRAKTDREAAAADKTLASALGQSLEQVAERVADKVAERLASVVADKFADAFAASITSEVVDRIASIIVSKVAAKTEGQSAEKSPVATTRPASPASQTSPEPPRKIGKEDHDGPTEAVIWVAAASPDPCVRQDSMEMADKMEPEPTAASLDTPPKTEAEPQVTLADLPGPVPSENRPATKRRSPEAEDAPPQKKARTADDVVSRRNPKRAANVAAAQAGKYADALPDDLLTEALRPLSAEEIQAWEGWVELESEPVRDARRRPMSTQQDPLLTDSVCW